MMIFHLFVSKLQEYYGIPQTFSFSGNGTVPKIFYYLPARDVG